MDHFGNFFMHCKFGSSIWRNTFDIFRCDTIQKVDDGVAYNISSVLVNFTGQKKGVPYINIPLAGAIVVSFAQFCSLISKEIQKPSETTKILHTTCVEVRYEDGTTISIDSTKVENEIARNMYETSELDWLVYNTPMDYVNLFLHRDIREYMKNVTEYTT